MKLIIVHDYLRDYVFHITLRVCGGKELSLILAPTTTLAYTTGICRRMC